MIKQFVTITILATAVNVSTFASESMGSVAKSKAIMERVSNYIVELQERRSSQTVQEVMDEKIATIDENIDAIAEASELTDSEIRELRMQSYAQLDKYVGIEDVSVITELEIAELQETMTSANVMFMLTKANLDWYRQLGSCYTPVLGQAGCVMWTVLLTPFAVVGDIVLLPVTFTISAATGF